MRGLSVVLMTVTLACAGGVSPEVDRVVAQLSTETIPSGEWTLEVTPRTEVVSFTRWVAWETKARFPDGTLVPMSASECRITLSPNVALGAASGCGGQTSVSAWPETICATLRGHESCAKVAR